MESFIVVFFFAFSTTITPGPNNIMIMSSGVNYGIKASLPHFLGICFGFPAMVLVVGMGFGSILEQFPLLHQLIKVAGTLYLLWLAWVIGSQTPKTIEKGNRNPLTFWQAVLFQWVNGKAWVMATGAVAAFTTVAGTLWSEVIEITAAFLAVAFPCVGIWLIAGAGLRQLLTNHTAQRIFNISMALLLVFSVLPVVEDILKFYFT